jgi:hypothetical protein
MPLHIYDIADTTSNVWPISPPMSGRYHFQCLADITSHVWPLSLPMSGRYHFPLPMSDVWPISLPTCQADATSHVRPISLPTCLDGGPADSPVQQAAQSRLPMAQRNPPVLARALHKNTADRREAAATLFKTTSRAVRAADGDGAWRSDAPPVAHALRGEKTSKIAQALVVRVAVVSPVDTSPSDISYIPL